jgi:hypothetical protein
VLNILEKMGKEEELVSIQRMNVEDRIGINIVHLYRLWECPLESSF